MLPGNSRKNALLQGITCTAVSALAFAAILMHKSGAHPANSWNGRQIGTEPMPRWMAVGVATLFGIIGLAGLVPAVLNLSVPPRVGRAVANGIGVYFLGFFDVICIRCLVVGDRFIQLSFVPYGVNTVLSWAVWGIFIVGFSGFAAGCFVGIFTALRGNGVVEGGTPRAREST